MKVIKKTGYYGHCDVCLAVIVSFAVPMVGYDVFCTACGTMNKITEVDSGTPPRRGNFFFGR